MKFRPVQGPFVASLRTVMLLTSRWISSLSALHVHTLASQTSILRAASRSSGAFQTARHKTTITFPPSQRRPLARRLLKPLSIAASAALVGTGLYYSHEPSRHFICALERCGRAGLVGVRVAINYKSMLSKPYQDDEERERAESACHLKSANLVLTALKKSGGIYIKLGQHASAMVYLLPDEWTSTMAVLQDQCPPTPYEEIEELFQTDLGVNLEDLFSEFDPAPIGVASLAQVHRARLRENGQEVACKIDINTVSFIFSTIKRIFPEFGFEWLSEEMNESLPQELNFEFEADNANKVRENFKDLIKKKKTALVIPEIVWARRRILCMECKCI
jgi:aarF domain-containing kinase